MREHAEQILRDSLGLPTATFHAHQWESIEALVVARHRMLVVQRTGWGKSTVYFISTRILREQGYGPTIIISPLLALMRNQIDSAAKYGVELGSINSANSNEDNLHTKNRMLSGELDAVIISPEQLAKDSFIEDVLLPVADNIGLFVVDEAHCISDWGHDFRPDYKRIRNILRLLPENLPVLATTATANDRVVEDISHQLGDTLGIFRGELTRSSIRLQNICLPDTSERLAWLADQVPLLNGTGIIYTLTIRDAESVAAWLRLRGVDAEAYYGTLKGLKGEENRIQREALEQKLLTNDIKVLVATSALGMGYDKPDLSFVIHFQCPGSVINYYQQVGRAGRSIPEARGILLSGKEDDQIQEFFISQAFPKDWLVESILQNLAEATNGLKKAELEELINARPTKIEAALKFLMAENPAPIIKQETSYFRTSVHYQLPLEMIRRLSDRKRQEWAEIQEYIQHDGCLMLYLAKALDDRLAEDCGKCANCAPDQIVNVDYSPENGIMAAEFIRHSESEIKPRSQGGSSGADAAARFPIYEFGYNLGDLKHQPGQALSRWGDAGWSGMVKQGKDSGQFSDELVIAVTEMVNNRWQPNPKPTWVTCVPSLRRPNLVPDFAAKVAGKLGLPFIPAVHKGHETEPQKNMENSFHRCNNLDGSFSIEGVKAGEPVFLIDDAVDSGWTFAIIAALLIREGSGPVFPLALVDTSTG